MFQMALLPAFAPFTIALLAVAGLLLLEITSLIAGKSLSALLEGLMDGHGADGGLGSVFDWLNPAGVPLLIYAVIVLTLFGMGGFTVQMALLKLTGAELPAWMAGVAALIPALPLSRGLSRLVGRMIPQIETYALDEATLIGQPAMVTMGPVQVNMIARAKVQDRTGNWHFPKVAPMNPEDVIPEGEWVVIVEATSTVLKVVRASALSPPAQE